jgi:Family of unknown function (DUF5681)
MTNKKVGYGRPPVHTRFKPGQSGNPSGRPKNTKTLEAEVIAELGEVTEIRENGKEVQVTKARAIAKELVHLALSGNLRAVTTLLSFYTRVTSGDPDGDQVTAEDRQLFDQYLRREARRTASANNDDETQQHGKKE